jgi:hypothetical protein
MDSKPQHLHSAFKELLQRFVSAAGFPYLPEKDHSFSVKLPECVHASMRDGGSSEAIQSVLVGFFSLFTIEDA